MRLRSFNTFLLPVKLLTAMPTFKCFAGLYLPSVAANGMYLKNKRIFIFFASDFPRFVSGLQIRYVKNWTSKLGDVISPLYM